MATKVLSEAGGAVRSRVPRRWVLGWELGGRQRLSDRPVLVAVEDGAPGTVVEAPELADAAWTELAVHSRLAQAELAQRLTAPLSAEARVALRRLQRVADDDGCGQVRLELGPAGDALLELVQHDCVRSLGYAAHEQLWRYRLAPPLRRGWLTSLRRAVRGARRASR